MIVILFRILLVIAAILVFYTIFQYCRNPKRKLHLAKKRNEFFVLDDMANSKKNLQFVYNGCLFEGEKYLGTTERSFDVVTIQVFVPEPAELKGITRDDLYFLEKEINQLYPYAKIDWKYPIGKLLERS